MIAEGSGFSCSRLRLDNLFLQWFSRPESQELVRRLLEDVKAGRPVSAGAWAGGKRGAAAAGGGGAAAAFALPASTPPLSPNKSSGLGPAGPSGPSPASPPARSPPPALRLPPGGLAGALLLSPQPAAAAPPGSPAPLQQQPPPPQQPLAAAPPPALALAPGAAAAVVPPFYFPRPAAPGAGEAAEAAGAAELRRFFAAEAAAAAAAAGPGAPPPADATEVGLDALKRLLRSALGLPSALAYPLMYRLAPAGAQALPRPALAAWLAAAAPWGKPPAARAFDILRRDGAAAVEPGDLRPLLAGVVVSHPGLEFLRGAPEFQERYAETVIHRVFYSLCRSGGGRLSAREFARGDLLQALAAVDACDDINRVERYFSYEHFYVVYCKFWDLDGDHDFLLDQNDLLRYGAHALTYRAAERVMAQAGRPFAAGAPPGRMGYEDFVWFILSEEDKATDTALEYWFRVVDLDGDGRLTPDELLHFYEEQLHRMECLAQEPVAFPDVLAQLVDMVEPADPRCFTLRDLKRRRDAAATLFNVLFNLNKFVAFETRDPFASRAEREAAAAAGGGGAAGSEWDRFARAEYLRLAVEEEETADEASDGVAWGSALDAVL